MSDLGGPATRPRTSTIILTLIISLYLVLAAAYAIKIPKWNAPDEPSHYNYVKAIAVDRRFPILARGDYDFDYLEKLKSAHFPDGMPIDRVRYESHQPPLYYLLATPLFWATAALPIDAQVVLLRMLSVLFGALTILVAYATLRRVFRDRALVPLAVAAFIASVPMYIAITAAIENDSLANLMLSLAVLACVRIVEHPRGARRSDAGSLASAGETPASVGEPVARGLVPRRGWPGGERASTESTPVVEQNAPPPVAIYEVTQEGAPHATAEQAGANTRLTIPASLPITSTGPYPDAPISRLRFMLTREHVVLGSLLGLALLTKTTSSIAVILIGCAVMAHEFRSSASLNWPRIVGRLARIYAVALAISAWWLARNVWVYGNLDLFGLKRHDVVVVGQPLTGPINAASVKHFITVSFQSFWAQFGWMGILVDERIYLLLGALCALSGLGLILFVIRVLRCSDAVTPHQKWSLAFLALSLALLTAGVIQYNLTYIQAQGRYFFPAIVAIGTFFVLGIKELVSPRHDRILFVVLFVGMFIFDVVALVRFIMPVFSS
ncbi:MAG: glycosyltransferase family 39 protein [Chloroflexi bacterium]|nr:glycosyltransferase family 39 protein [Chloroflexota bacterium]